ncbi:MAG: ParB/RepB/Spo0J family partition protein [Acutalibacteraceae bacterium]
MLKSTVNIPIEKLHQFEGHPFSIPDNNEMNMLIESIQQNGIINPLIVRPKENTEDEYEVVSGHRRLRAARKAGLKTVPALIYSIDRETAIIMMVDSNLQRENILPSEKAKAFKMKMDAISHQGKSTSRQLVDKLKSAEFISQSESGRQVQRYIRLTHLIPELSDTVDKGKISFTPAVEISYLTEEEQKNLLETIQSEECTPSLSQAQKMKQLSQLHRLDIDMIFKIMTTAKPNQKEFLKLNSDKYDKFLGKFLTTKDKEEHIFKALEFYDKHQRKKDITK